MATRGDLSRRRGPVARGPRRRPRAWALAAAVTAAPACAPQSQTLSVEITVGHEADALDRAPAVVRVDVVATDGVGAVSKASAAPGGSFDLGELRADDIVSIEVTGVDASGASVVRGRSLSGIYLGAVSSDLLPVFVQRTGEWARPPGALAHAHVAGVGGSLAERYLLLSGGSAALGPSGAVDPSAVAAYDLFGLQSASEQAFPEVPRSLVTLSSSALVIGDGGASALDFGAATTGDVAPPSGLGSFGDVAGGATIPAGDGSFYVVGATRPGPATRAVLHVASDGTPTALALASPRAGAAAAWIADVGLVVAGGSASAPGVEILSTAGSAFAATTFPPDATVGAAVTPAAKGSFAMIGGAVGGKPSPTRTFAVDCGTSCKGVPVAGASLPVATARAAAFALGGERALFVGDEAAKPGATRVFLVDLGARSLKELALREPRAGATPIAAPNGTLALLGGVHADGSPALSIEAFFPE
jgi:hypothetical protein